MINMIYDVTRSIDDQYRVRIETPCSLTLCQAFGWFENIMNMNGFFESMPSVTIEETNEVTTMSVDFKYTETIDNELLVMMERLGFKVSEDNISDELDRKYYVFKYFYKKRE